VRARSGERVRFNSSAPPVSHVILSLAHKLPIVNLIVSPWHPMTTGGGTGVGVYAGTGVAVGAGAGVGKGV